MSAECARALRARAASSERCRVSPYVLSVRLARVVVSVVAMVRSVDLDGRRVACGTSAIALGHRRSRLLRSHPYCTRFYDFGIVTHLKRFLTVSRRHIHIDHLSLQARRTSYPFFIDNRACFLVLRRPTCNPPGVSTREKAPKGTPGGASNRWTVVITVFTIYFSTVVSLQYQ